MIRTRVGADLWKVDQFGLLGDDDPSFAVFITPSPDLQFHVRAVVQTEATRLGLTNDNDDLYYTFGARYTGMKGHTFQLDGAYFRFRFDPQFDTDTFMIIPNYEGNLGIVRLTALFAAVFGEVDGAAGENYDVAAFSFIAHAVANLGKLRPFVGVVYGSADDDATDNDLNGFHHLPRQSISLGSGDFEWGLTSPSVSDWGPSAGANAAVGGGILGASTTGNMYLDRLGNTAHPGTSVVYSNAGTLRFGVGTHFLPWKGHRITGYYQYVGFLDDATLGGDFDKDLFHELAAVWSWSVNRHFDVRALVNIHLPGGGTKDIAATVLTCGDGTQACEGEDIAVRGTLRFRAMF